MSKAKGDVAEEKVNQFLLENGYLVKDRNFYSRFGEIDIIAQKGDVLHFIEVKSAKEYEVAVQNITPKKVSRIIRTIDVYLKRYALDVEYCIDAVIVVDDDIEMVENITI